MVHVSLDPVWSGISPPSFFGNVPPDLFSPAEPVFVVGGGPSIKNLDMTRLRGRQTIGANNAALDFSLDVLFWSDRRWSVWNAGRIRAYRGRKFTRARPDDDLGEYVRLKYRPHMGLGSEPDTVSGGCSGAGAVNVAYLGGGCDFVLIGFDMRDDVGNYHNAHQGSPIPGQRGNTFVPAMERMGRLLEARGCRLRVVGDSALSFERVDFDAVTR